MTRPTRSKPAPLLALLAIFPGLATWLPKMVFGS